MVRELESLGGHTPVTSHDVDRKCLSFIAHTTFAHVSLTKVSIELRIRHQLHDLKV